jgi:hypothetical protein
MAHAQDYLRFARESFGALHQMLAGLTPAQREEAWQEISTELSPDPSGTAPLKRAQWC